MYLESLWALLKSYDIVLNLNYNLWAVIVIAKATRADTVYMVDCCCCTINAHWLPHCTIAMSLLLLPVQIVTFLLLVGCYHFTIFAVASLLKQLELTLPTLLLAIAASMLIDSYFWIELNSKGFDWSHLTTLLPCLFLLLLLLCCCFLPLVVCYCQYVKAIADTIYTAACGCITITTDWLLIIN